MILIEREGESVWDFTQDELIGLSKLKDHTARRWESQGQGQDFKCRCWRRRILLVEGDTIRRKALFGWQDVAMNSIFTDPRKLGGCPLYCPTYGSQNREEEGRRRQASFAFKIQPTWGQWQISSAKMAGNHSSNSPFRRKIWGWGFIASFLSSFLPVSRKVFQQVTAMTRSAISSAKLKLCLMWFCPCLPSHKRGAFEFSLSFRGS